MDTITTNKVLPVVGAICGDILGSQYERRGKGTKSLDHELGRPHDKFTDDTVCTIAVAEAIQGNKDIAQSLRRWCHKYPKAGYGRAFKKWLADSEPTPYDSWGNGSAMRVSGAAVYASSLEDALELAKKSAEITHNHPEGIKGAQSVAAAIWMAWNGATKEEIKRYVGGRFLYNLDLKYYDIQPDYTFSSWSQSSVPESIICFLESYNYEDAVRHAIAMGGDADTMAAIAGSIAAAFYKHIPTWILQHCKHILPADILNSPIVCDFDWEGSVSK